MSVGRIVARATTVNDVSYIIKVGEKGYDVDVEACFLEEFTVECFPTVEVAKRYCTLFDNNVEMLYYVSLDELQGEIMGQVVEEYEKGLV